MMKGACWNYVDPISWWGYVWVATLLTLTLTVPAAVCQEYIAKGCPGGREDSPPVDVDLACPEGQVIALGEAKLGRNKYESCTITDGDCLDKTDAFEGCEGRSNCTVHFNRPFSPTCGYASFITVSYDCRTATSPPTSVSSTTRDVSSRVDDTITTTVRTTTDKGQTDSKDPGEDNTALIAGCVVAVVVTIILLIIAIVMVVRRLACGAELSDDEEKKSTACYIWPCSRTEQNENSPKHGQDEADSPNSSQNDDKNRGKRKRKLRGRRADKNQNMSPRLAPVGQEDEDEHSVSPNKNVAVAACASASGEMAAAAGSSARSSVVMEAPAAQVKRHSSGAKGACGDITMEHCGVQEGSERDDFSRRYGGGGGGRRGAQTQGRGVGSAHGSGGRTRSTGFSAADINRMQPDSASQDRGPPTKAHKAPGDKQTAMTSKRHQYDAVAVPNTETFTSC